MKRYILILLLLLISIPVFTQAESEDAAILATLEGLYPRLQSAVTVQCANTAAAAFEHEGIKMLCVLEKDADEWQLDFTNPRALMQAESLPRLWFNDCDTLRWCYPAYPESIFTATRTAGVWGNVSQMTRPIGGAEDTFKEEVVYEDGQILHIFNSFDKDGSAVKSHTETMPAAWLENHIKLRDFDIGRFPVLGYVEYPGQWPESDFISQAAAYLMPNYEFISGSYVDGRLEFLIDKMDGTRVFVGCGTGINPKLVESSPLPENTRYGVENFTNSLGIGPYCVTLGAYDKDSDRCGASRTSHPTATPGTN